MLNRDIDAAAQDVQSAINAAGSTLPRNLPYPPTYSKVNPADAPIITLALTSETISMRNLSDLADTLMAQRLSSVPGVGHVSVEGGIKPAVRIQADLVAARLLRACAWPTCATPSSPPTSSGPKGSLDGPYQSYTIAANDQITSAEAYQAVIVAYRNNAPVLLERRRPGHREPGEHQGRRLVPATRRPSSSTCIASRAPTSSRPCSASAPSCRGCSAPCRAASS